MDTLGIIIPSVLYLLFLALGIYIIIQNPQRKVMWYFGGWLLCAGIYVFGSIFGRIGTSYVAAATWIKFSFVPSEIGIILWLLTFQEFAKELKLGIRLNKFTMFTIVSIDVVLLVLLVFSNTLIDYSSPIFIGSNSLSWDFYSKDAFLLKNFAFMLQMLLPVINSLIFFFKSKEKQIKRFGLVMFLASAFLFIGVNLNCFIFFLRVRYPEFYRFPEVITEIFILIAEFLTFWIILSPKLLVRDMYEIVKDFLTHIGSSLLLIIPYLVVVIVGFFFIQEEELLLFIILSISGLVILTHSTREWILEFIRVSIRQKQFTIPTLLPSEVNEVLRNLSSPNLLADSKLLKLKKVGALAKKKSISKVEALIEVITETIKYFKPKDESDKRTLARMKYEILRMMAFEGATESQIMWDLGFDVYTRSVEEKLSEEREPRFRLKDGSEYSATSVRSFKRLKKEAIEMLRWKLEEGEKF